MSVPASRLTANIAVTVASQLMVVAGGLVLYRELASTRGTSGLADYALTKQGTSLVLVAVMLGLGTAVPRQVAVAGQRKDADDNRSMLLLAAVMVCAVTSGVLALVAALWAGGVASLVFGSASKTELVWPLWSTIAATAAFRIAYGYRRGESRFGIISLVEVIGVAAVPALLVVLFPSASLGQLIEVMALVLTCLSLAAVAPTLAKATARVFESRSGFRVALRDLLDYGARRVVGDGAYVALLALPPILIVHEGSIRDVALMTVGLQLLAILAMAVFPLGLVLLPSLAQLHIANPAAAAARVRAMIEIGGELAAFCGIQLFLFADILAAAWLGPQFAGPDTVLRLTVAPGALYVYYLLLRSAVDAAAVRAYNGWNAVASLAAFGCLAFFFRYVPIAGRPAVAVAVALALALGLLGGATVWASIRLYRIAVGLAPLARAAAAGAVTGGLGVVLRLVALQISGLETRALVVICGETVLAALFVTVLVATGETWPRAVWERIAPTLTRRKTPAADRAEPGVLCVDVSMVRRP